MMLATVFYNKDGSQCGTNQLTLHHQPQ